MVPASVTVGTAVVSQPKRNLPNLHLGINPHWLNHRQFKRPVRTATEVAEVCGHIQKYPKPANGRTAEEQGHVSVAPDSFERSAQIDLAGF